MGSLGDRSAAMFFAKSQAAFLFAGQFAEAVTEVSTSKYASD